MTTLLKKKIAASSMKEKIQMFRAPISLYVRVSHLFNHSRLNGRMTRALGPFSILFFASHFLFSSSAALNIETLLSPYGVRWPVKAAAAVHRCFSLSPPPLKQSFRKWWKSLNETIHRPTRAEHHSCAVVVVTLRPDFVHFHPFGYVAQQGETTSRSTSQRDELFLFLVS